MTDKQALLVRSIIDTEGFDYAFVNYSMFKEIKDGDFHKLREAYLDAQAALAKYCGVD